MDRGFHVEPPDRSTSNSVVTVGNAVTLSAAVGNTLGLTVNSGGKVSVTAGTLNVGGVVTFNGGCAVARRRLDVECGCP